MITQFDVPADYPRDWDAYIGQHAAKRQLRLAARSARQRGEPLDHCLITGSSGNGKTSLALLTAEEMGTQLVMVSGRIDAVAARVLFSDLDDGNVVFWDEVHQAVAGGKKYAEWLLHYLQDGVLIGPRGPEECPRVTIIAATTDVGRLPETIVSRFMLRPQLADYTVDEAADIAGVMGDRVLLPDVKPLGRDDCLGIAVAGNCNPRSIRRLLHTLRDLAVTGEIEPDDTGNYDLDAVFEVAGVTSDGLDATMQKYLRLLLTEFGGKAGERALMDRLQEPGGLGEIERVLCEKNLVTRTRAGREITSAGIRRSRELMK